MKIFLCHASEDKPSVEPIQLALASAGHQVFYDERSLPPASDYNGRILNAIIESDLFIFILSEHSLRPGKYTLSELEFAKQRWTSPVNRVLTVNLFNHPIKEVPAYLTATTILTIKGHAAVEVRSAVANIVSQNQQADTSGIEGSGSSINDDFILKETSNTSPSNAGTVNIAGNVSGGTVIGTQVNHTGFTLEEYNKALSARERELRTQFQESLDGERANTDAEKEKRILLKVELEGTQSKLGNLEDSYEKTQSLLSEASESLNELKDKIPAELLKKAEFELEKGETDVAYQAFATIADDGSKPIAKAAYEAARLAENEVRYADADRYYTKAILLDENDPTFLDAAGSMADTLGDYRRAEPLRNQALTIRKMEFGEEHPSTATSYNNVASNLNAQGKYEEAEPLYRKGLAISERVLGEEHPDTATSYNNVAYNLNAQGKYEAAEPLYRKGLAISERVLGEEHPDTAASYNNVAYNLNAQGKYEAAEPLLRKGLAICERVLGEEHPSTATSYNNVAGNLNAQGKYEAAEPLFRKGLAIRERVLGEEHPSTAASYNNVAYNLNAQGKYEEAEPLFRKAMNILVKVLGSEHPTTKIITSNREENLKKLSPSALL